MTYTDENTLKEATINGFRVNYNDAGEGPVLVMLHGGGAGASGWSNFGANLPTFTKYFRVLLINQPGFGGSGYPDHFDEHYLGYTARMVAGLLDHLGIDQAHLLGNSLGAAATVRMALDHADRIKRIVLMGTGSNVSVGMFAPRPAEGILKLNAFNANPSLEGMEAFLRALAFNQHLITPELVQARFDAATGPGSQEGNKAMFLGMHDERFARDGELWRICDGVLHDTLITWGREDRVQPLDGAFLAAKLMPNARLYIIPKCGHWAQVDAKDEFERVAVSFLRNEL
ncbi:MAG TPA: alpha/beta fold hydrolase [Ilumatobacteraceae bacterium]|jgi:4,5:9,10-diseco-3-hydroxy-5,9,17-trioxoandrosta-1(10),2-diene-4-oate hydrolase